MASSGSTSFLGGNGDARGLNILEKLLIDNVNRNEIQEIKKYKHGKCIDKHLNIVDSKLSEMNVEESDKAKFLIDTLDSKVKHELYSSLEFKSNKNDYTWVSKRLKDLFHEKQSTVNKLLELLKIKQSPSQRIRDFLSDIRVKSWKLMMDDEEDKREEYCVMAFINGLLNHKYSLALKELSPKTLDEAYRLLKREDKAISANNRSND